MTATRKASFAEQTTPASATQTTTLASATLNAGATSNAYSFALGNIYLAAGDSVEFVSHAIAATDSAGVSVTVTGIPVTRAVEDNPFLFLGGLGYWNEPNLGLSYVRARWLDTGTGQWLSVDPVDGEPRYSYAYQSPTLFTDASGTQTGNHLLSPEQEEVARYLLAPVRTVVRDAVRGIKNSTGVDLSPHHLAAVVEPWYRHQAETTSEFWQAFQSRTQRYIAPGMALVGLNFLNREEASWRSMVKSTPFPFNTYLPPYYKKPQMVPYAAGFLWGALSSVYHMFFDDPVTMLNQAKEAAVDAYRTILYVIDLASTPEFWQHLGPIINNFFGHLVPPLPASMPQYDRGKRAGIFLVNIVMLILTVIDLMNLPEVIMGLFRNLKGLFTTLRNAGGMVQKFLGDGKAVESLQQMLRGFGKIDKEALKDLSRQKIRDVQRAVERIRNKTASGLPSASAISKAVPLRELVALLAKQLGVDLNSVQTPVKMFSEVKSELGELSQDRFMSGETKAAFRVSEKDGSRSIVVGDQFFEQAEAGQMTMNQYIRLAHEIRHAMVYDRLLTELGGDWRQAMLIDREISTNLYYKEVNEATTQYWAIEQIQSLHPSQTIPQNEWNYYAEHMNRARLRYRDARNLNLTPAQRAAASNSFGFKIFNVK